jgi:hypothetical protein
VTFLAVLDGAFPGTWQHPPDHGGNQKETEADCKQEAKLALLLTE